MMLHTPRGKVIAYVAVTPWHRWFQWGRYAGPTHRSFWLGPVTFVYRRRRDWPPRKGAPA